MTLKCITVCPIGPVNSSTGLEDTFELRHESHPKSGSKEWILTIYSDLTPYVHNQALIIKTPTGNPPFGVPDSSEDITAHYIGDNGRNTTPFNTIILCND